MEFKDRKRELEDIHDILEQDHFQFVIIYGRRRVSKIELLLKAIKPRNG